MTVGAIVQARTGSTRLPGKVLKSLNNHTMLGYLVDRISNARGLDRIVVATASTKENDPVEAECEDLDVPCYRGKEEDLLDRYHQAAKAHDLDLIVRITADCPLVDYRIIDDMLASYREREVDYLPNNMPRTFPHGMDLSIFPASVVKRVWQKTSARPGRHITEYIRTHSTLRDDDEFFAWNHENDIDFSHVRLTVDYPEDLEVVRFLADRCDLTAPWLEYVALLTRHPEYIKQNRQHVDT